MKRLYLLKVKIMEGDDGYVRQAYAFGATEHTLNTGSPVRSDAFELFSLSGNKIEVFDSPVPLDHVGTFTDDDEFCELVEGINAEPVEPGRDIDEEDVA